MEIQTDIKSRKSGVPLSYTNGLLDKLAQLAKVSGQIVPTSIIESARKAKELESRKKLQKRARCKYITTQIATALSKLDSPLKKSYKNSIFCNNLISQNGNELTAKYCKNRWCLNCNRIRTGFLINGYTEPLKELNEKRFVTLTIPNVKESELPGTITEMLKRFRMIQKTFQKRKTPVVGIRKMECTYNYEANTYHPHFHLIIEGQQTGNDIIDQWVKHYPEAEIWLQKNLPADDNTIKELFKYFTKLISKNSNKLVSMPIIHIKSLDIIFRAMKGKRVFQPMGFKKKIDEENAFDEITAETYSIEPQQTEWSWENEASDWINVRTGECLAQYTPSENVLSILESINNSS